MEEIRYTHKILDPEPEGKRPLVTVRRRWENNIKIYFKAIFYESAERIYLARNRYQ
jgi:hypothetical protein